MKCRKTGKMDEDRGDGSQGSWGLALASDRGDDALNLDFWIFSWLFQK